MAFVLVASSSSGTIKSSSLLDCDCLGFAFDPTFFFVGGSSSSLDRSAVAFFLFVARGFAFLSESESSSFLLDFASLPLGLDSIAFFFFGGDASSSLERSAMDGFLLTAESSSFAERFVAEGAVTTGFFLGCLSSLSLTRAVGFLCLAGLSLVSFYRR